MRKCYGCGAKAETHPWVGVIRRSDVPARTDVIPNPVTGSEFVGVAVCDACHRDPAHRTAHALKCHFFPAGNRSVVGLALAGSSDIG